MTQPKAPWTTMPGVKLKQKAVRKRIRSATSQRAKQLRIYRERAAEFIRKYPLCQVWLNQNKQRWPELSQMSYARLGCPLSTEVHHTRGRRNELLLDERYWLAVSYAGHSWIHNNMDEARKIGVLCEKGKWGKAE